MGTVSSSNAGNTILGSDLSLAGNPHGALVIRFSNNFTNPNGARIDDGVDLDHAACALCIEGVADVSPGAF